MATNDTAGTGAHRATASGGSADEAPPEVAELQADIERTRADLADTVDQLTAKLDVKNRVRGRVAATKDEAAAQLSKVRDRATDDQGRPTRSTIGIGGGAVAAVVAVVLVAWWRRHHTSRRPTRWRP